MATEEETLPIPNYMDYQYQINSGMRAMLIDWIVEVHRKFNMLPETLFLTVNLIDRFLSTTQIKRSDLQLVGVTAMVIASKYEEIYPPVVNDFVYFTDNAYTRERVLEMEEKMLMTLQFGIHTVSPYRFFERFVTLKNAN